MESTGVYWIPLFCRLQEDGMDVVLTNARDVKNITERKTDESDAEELMLRYHVGTSKHWPGATVFWQVDISGRVRTGKVMLYNPENGRRIKEPHNYITRVHSLLKKENFNLRQCLFGEHLLASDQQRPVALVESEKSALISSFYLPQYLWIASSGKNGAFNRDCHERIKKPTCPALP